MSRGIVYTSVFGNYDDIIEQKLPSDWDWKCFSEENSLSSIPIRHDCTPTYGVSVNILVFVADCNSFSSLYTTSSSKKE